MLGEQDDVEQFLFMLRKKGDCKCENKILVQSHVSNFFMSITELEILLLYKRIKM